MALGSAALSADTYADTVTSTMSVSATVGHSCSIDSNPMAFGAYDRVVANASTALEATATVVSTCTSGAAALITMNAGASAGSGSADAPVRRMTAGAGEYLVYQVYSDVARGTVWGNTAPTGVALTGTGVSQTLTAYGSVPSAQLAAQGVYSDQIGVTITF
ncbi:MAG: spore coat U domain-containing protein [Pseudomonadales bacterium]|jgi:spore coat protein U-like protein|tara:strand:- start:124 stop:606 length:483 start_codon:yes stop_codon:yes gene_type:complete